MLSSNIKRIVEEGICQIEVPVSAVFAAQKELMVGGLLANVGIGIVLPILPSSLATGSACADKRASLTCSIWRLKWMSSLIRYLQLLERRTWICKNVFL